MATRRNRPDSDADLQAQAEREGELPEDMEAGEDDWEQEEEREPRRWSPRALTRRNGQYDEVDSLVTAVAVGGTAALIEAELLPGILIGAGALLFGRMFPQVGGVVRPVLKGVIRAGYAVTDSARGMVSEAGEQVRDMVAEVQSERTPPRGARTRPMRRTRAASVEEPPPSATAPVDEGPGAPSAA